MFCYKLIFFIVVSLNFGMNKVDVSSEEKCSRHPLKRHASLESIKYENNRSSSQNSRAFRRQLLASSGAIVASISFGLTTGFTATLIPQLAANETSIIIDENTESWIAGTVVLSMPLGVILNSFIMQQYGRKISQIFSCLPWIIGWPCMSFAADIWTLLLGCLLVGFATGLSTSVNNVYVSEVCEPRYRGFVSVLVSVGVTSGILFAHLLGVFLFWRTALLTNIIAVVISFLLLLYAPESPNWFVLKNKPQKARRVFSWLRDNTADDENELNILLGNRIKNTQLQNRGICRNLRSKTFLKPFFILTLMFAVQQGSGLNMIIFYAISILSKISAVEINAQISTIAIDVVRVFATLIACFLIKYIGRRTLFFGSATCVFVSLIGIIVSLLYRFPSIIVTIFFCFNVLSTFAGIVPIPWIMIGEIYPTAVKDMGSGISTVMVCLAIFIIVKTGPLMIANIGIELTFTIYAIIVFIGSVALYFCMPETNNKTLQQVEDKIKNQALVNNAENLISKF